MVYSQDIECISRCCAGGPCRFSVLCIIVSVSSSHTPSPPLALPVPSGNRDSIPRVCYSVPVLQISSFVSWVRFHTSVISCGLYLSDLPHWVWSSPGAPTLLPAARLLSLLWLSSIPLYTCGPSSVSVHLFLDVQVASMASGSRAGIQTHTLTVESQQLELNAS